MCTHWESISEPFRSHIHSPPPNSPGSYARSLSRSKFFMPSAFALSSLAVAGFVAGWIARPAIGPGSACQADLRLIELLDRQLRAAALSAPGGAIAASVLEPERGPPEPAGAGWFWICFVTVIGLCLCEAYRRVLAVLPSRPASSAPSGASVLPVPGGGIAAAAKALPAPPVSASASPASAARVGVATPSSRRSS